MTYGITNAGGGKSADLGTKSITQNDTYLASDDGLDGYSEVTVNVQTAPTLQSKIARQNGTVTADDGYDGLSSVDVMVGQVGQSYSCLNYTGASIAQYDKCWLEYKAAVQAGNFGLPNGQWYDNVYNINYLSIDGSWGLYDRSYSGSGWNLYKTTETGYTNLYNYSSWSSRSLFTAFYDQDAMLLYGTFGNFTSGLSSPASFTLATSGAVETYATQQLGFGFYQTWSSGSMTGTLYDSSGNAYTKTNGASSYYRFYQMLKINNNYKLLGYDEISYNNPRYVLYDVDTSNKTITIGSSSSYGSDRDAYYRGIVANKYALFLSPYASNKTKVYDISTGTLYTSGSFKGLNLAYQVTGPYNPLSKCVCTLKDWNSSSYTGLPVVYKYDETNDEFTDITSEYGTLSGSYQIPGCAAGENHEVLSYSQGASTSWSAAYALLATSESWAIKPSSSLTVDSLTGYAAANIAAGATGNVIVGQRVDGTSITATNNSSYDRISGEKVWLLENNGSYQITDVLGLTSRSFTGITKEAIAIGASGACEATVGGELVVRWARNFSIAGGPSIDDGARIVTFTGGYQGVYKVLTTGTSTPTTSVTVQLKSKFTGSGSNHNQSTPFAVFGSGYGSYANVDYPLLELVNTKGLYYRIKQGIGNVGAQEKTLLDNTAWVNNKWYWIKLEVTDTLVASYWSEDGTTWNVGPAISGSGILASFANRTVFGFRSFYDNTTYNGTIDMNESWVKVDGDYVWQPYAPITE